jgi:predicted nucleic acid-binding Zn ribbon protein
MIKKKENCLYCGEKMESLTAKKRFCSEKCRVYFNRSNKTGKTTAILGVSKPKADNVTKLIKKPVELALNGQEQPPEGLAGIDLAIWKSENWG